MHIFNRNTMLSINWSFIKIFSDVENFQMVGRNFLMNKKMMGDPSFSDELKKQLECETTS